MFFTYRMYTLKEITALGLGSLVPFSTDSYFEKPDTLGLVLDLRSNIRLRVYEAYHLLNN